MSAYFEEAKKKLKAEAGAGKFDKYGSAMKSAVVKALEEFCSQSELFAEAVVKGGSFEECMRAVAKGVSGSISDLEAYKRAVKYYLKNADVRFCMEICVTTDETAGAGAAAADKVEQVIDLSAFL